MISVAMWQPCGGGVAGGGGVRQGAGKGGVAASSGIVRREDFGSYEAYVEALIESGTCEADVPHERVAVPEAGAEAYYVKCIVLAHFKREVGEGRAREIVAAEGGTWVSSAFSWDTGLPDATVEAYFPQADALESLEGVCTRLEQHVDEVAFATFDYGGAVKSFSGAYAVDDPHLPKQYGLDSRTLRLRGP